jgi:hypothetical protein
MRGVFSSHFNESELVDAKSIRRWREISLPAVNRGAFFLSVNKCQTKCH